MKNTSILFIFVSALVFFFALPVTTMASEQKPYLVYLHKTPDGMSCETYQLGALSKVLGSEDAAKKALIYHYSQVVSGFAARLTPQQAEELKKVPEVTSVTAAEPFKIFNPRHMI